MADRLTGAAGAAPAAAVEIHPRRSRPRRDAADPSGHVGADAGVRRACWASSTTTIPPPQKHDHVVLDMAGGARITFNDARRFGAMDLMPTDGAEAHPLLASLGPEPLGNDFQRTLSGRAAEGPRHADQVGAAGSADRRGPWQHLCLRSAVPRRHQPRAPGRAHLGATPRRGTGADHPRRCWPRRSRRAGRPCATTGRPMANLAISSTFPRL